MSSTEAIREILASHGKLPVDVASLADDADLYAAGLSSFASVQLMLAIEDRFDIEFPTARDPDATVAIRYGTNRYPESYLIDREGYVTKKYIGAENWMRPEVVNYLRSVL